MYARGILLSRGLGSDKNASILANGRCAVITQCSLIFMGEAARISARRKHSGSVLRSEPEDPTNNNVQSCEYYLHYAIMLWQRAQSGNSLNKANSLEILHMVWKQFILFSKYS
jgi:hypothetical protein